MCTIEDEVVVRRVGGSVQDIDDPTVSPGIRVYFDERHGVERKWFADGLYLEGVRGLYIDHPTRPGQIEAEQLPEKEQL
jgi:hypothetical protein